MTKLFIFLLVIPACAMAYAFDGEGEEQYKSDEIRQSPQFVVPGSGSLALQPAGEYRIGPLDLLDVEVFQVKDLKRTVRVNGQGEISMPLVGTLEVLGRTVSEVETMIEGRLKEKFMQNPHVSVFIAEYESQKITINGWVASPGIFPLKGKTTLIQALSMARGIKRLGDPTEVVIFREKPGVGTTGHMVNFEDVQAGRAPDPVLQNNDIVVVPENGSKAAFEETTRTLRTFLGFIPFL